MFHLGPEEQNLRTSGCIGSPGAEPITCTIWEESEMHEGGVGAFLANYGGLTVLNEGFVF